MNKVILLFLMLWIMTQARAQKPLFRHFSTDQGLSSTETYHTFQDSKGYIWISTINGVTRFDGYTFQNFDEQDGLSDNTIFETIEDYKGRIWFVGYNCKLSYYENGKIKLYQFNSAIVKVTSNPMLSVKKSFYIDRHDNVYLSIRYVGIIKISPSGNLTRLDTRSDNIADIFQTEDKILVAQHHGTENKLNININGLHSSLVDISLSKAINLGVIAVEASDHKSVFVACDHYILRVYNNGKYQIRSMASRIIWLSLDKDHMLWVCPFNGGALALNENNLMGPIVHNYLEDQSVSSVLHDKEGGFWFSTLGDGVFYLPSHNTFSYIYPKDLPDNEIVSVETGNNEIYAGTGNGFLSVIKNNKTISYPIDTNLHSEITTLSFDQHNKQLLIGSTYGAFVFKNGVVSPLMNSKNKTNKKYEGVLITTKSIIKESNDSYWLGNSTGLSLVNVNQNFVIFSSSRDLVRKTLRISTMYRYPNGDLLIGTPDGLWIHSNQHFSKVPGFIPGLNKRILKIVGDSLGKNIWVSVKGDGLYFKTSDSIYHLTRKNGLLNNSPTDLCLNNKDLWMATSQGISCITVKSTKPFQYSLHNFTVDNGLASNQVYQIKASGDKILVATNRGLSILARNTVNYKIGSIPVYLTKVRLMMKDTALKTNSSFPFNFNSISFSFVGISYQSISRIKYQYRLIGLDEEWRSTQNTEISFPFLPPHQYEFQLRTINDDGIITSTTVIQKFEIRPPFWKTGWFILILIVLVFSFGYLIYLNRVKRIERNNIIHQEINKYRQQALSKQMNPHFLFNSLNSIQYYIVKNDRISSSRYLTKFATLMRVILNNSQNQAISLNDELNALKLYLELESMRFKDRFEYTIEIDPLINQISTLVPPFIIQPFIENSIWHGLMNREGNGLLQIKLFLVDSILKCVVEDNGVGRQSAAEIEGSNPLNRPSKGISITETRLRLIDQKNIQTNFITYTDLYDHNGVPEGTRVEILIPILN